MHPIDFKSHKDRSQREEFLSEEDLDLINLSDEELIQYWNWWLQQASATDEEDAEEYSHGVFSSPEKARRLLEEHGREKTART